MIRYVNDAWVEFGLCNGLTNDWSWVGKNYLSSCERAADHGDKDAQVVVNGLYQVIENKNKDFFYEYPCHSPKQKRWYLLRAVPLKSDPHRFVISHQNVTQNKLIEKQAERLSLEDPLTGLYNRRGLDSLMIEEFSRAVRYQNCVGIVIIDLDYFKIYNDYYGHQAGDDCLQSIAQVIEKHTRRPGDIAARIGGDEFVLILSQTTRQQSLQVANAIRENIFAMNLKLPTRQIMTISAGVTSVVPTQNTNFKDLLYKEADAALYIAKKKRNSVFIIDKDMSEAEV